MTLAVTTLGRVALSGALLYVVALAPLLLAAGTGEDRYGYVGLSLIGVACTVGTICAFLVIWGVR